MPRIIEGSSDMPKQTEPRHTGAIEKTSIYKFKLIDKLLADDKLTKLIYYNSQDAVTRPSLNEEQLRHLREHNIYPWRFNPEFVETKTTYIGVDMADFQGATHQTLDGQITFFVYTHQDLMKTHFGARQDEIKGCIGRIFDKDTTIGMGEFQYVAAQPLYTHMNAWGGYAITFELTDLR